MSFNNDFIKKRWFGSVIKGHRELEFDSEESTYNEFNFDKLPPINKDLDSNFSWLKPVLISDNYRNPNYQEIESHRKEHLGKGINNTASILKLEKGLKKFGIKLPSEIKLFFSSANINGRLRSTTDNHFELGNFIEEVNLGKKYYLLHFMSDSQYCLFWYICFEENGSHFIITSPKLYGHEDGKIYNKVFEKDKPKLGYYCANSFKEFIYRYDIESRIWFKIKWYLIELNEEEKNYLKWYKNE